MTISAHVISIHPNGALDSILFPNSISSFSKSLKRRSVDAMIAELCCHCETAKASNEEASRNIMPTTKHNHWASDDEVTGNSCPEKFILGMNRACVDHKYMGVDATTVRTYNSMYGYRYNRCSDKYNFRLHVTGPWLYRACSHQRPLKFAKNYPQTLLSSAATGDDFFQSRMHRLQRWKGHPSPRRNPARVGPPHFLSWGTCTGERTCAWENKTAWTREKTKENKGNIERYILDHIITCNTVGTHVRSVKKVGDARRAVPFWG